MGLSQTITPFSPCTIFTIITSLYWPQGHTGGVSPAGMWACCVFITVACVRLHAGRLSSCRGTKELRGRREFKWLSEKFTGWEMRKPWAPLTPRNVEAPEEVELDTVQSQLRQHTGFLRGTPDNLISSKSCGFCEQWASYFLFPVSTEVQYPVLFESRVCFFLSAGFHLSLRPELCIRFSLSPPFLPIRECLKNKPESCDDVGVLTLNWQAIIKP